METRKHDLASRGFDITSEQSEDVVSATMPGLGNECEIRGESAVVGRTASLIVGVRGRELVGKFTGAIEHLTFLRTGLVAYKQLAHATV